MRKFALIFLFVFLPFTLFAGPERGRLNLETEFYPDPCILRVGSPVFNLIRNSLRNSVDAGESLSDTEFAILHVEEIEGVDPNTLLVFKNERSEEGWERSVVYEGYLNDRELNGWKLYLYSQATGWAEVFVEDGIYYTSVVTSTPVIGSLFEIYNALESDSVCQRFRNSGLAIWDASRGTAYAAVDIFSELSEGDVARAVKAAIRMPLTGAQLGVTVATKVVRLPFDLAMSAVIEIRRFFSDDNDAEETRTHDLDETLKQRIVDNNTYDAEINFGAETSEGTIAFYPYDNTGVFILNPQDPWRSFQWRVIGGYFVARLEWEGRVYALLGNIDGSYDIDIEGSVIEGDIGDLDELVQDPNWYDRLYAPPMGAIRGTFHFDD